MALKFVFLILFAFIVGHSYCSALPSFAVIMDENTVEKNGLAELFDINSTVRDAGTVDAVLDMYINVLKELPQNMKINVKIERMNDKGEYVRTPVDFQQKYCDFLRTDKLFTPLFLKYGNFYSKCPIKPDLYYVKDVSFTGLQLPLALPPGSYRATFVYSVDDLESSVVWKGKLVKA